MDCVVIVMAKAPVPGVAKTRLIPALGAAGAAALAQRMLWHTMEQALAAALGPVELCVTPDPGSAAFAALVANMPVRWSAQGPGDLGARMARAFERALVPPVRRALVIGTDAPALGTTILRRAAASLERHDAVFVPTFDGGYALVGLRRLAPLLFDAMPWSTSDVMATTRERGRASGLRFAELDPVADIDEPADLAHVPAGWWMTTKG